MIHFIVCEDNLFYQNKILSVIDKISFRLNLKCKRLVYNDFDEEFEKIIKEDITHKIYILDIETKSNTGTNIARKIRQTDTRSIIIFITSFFDKYLIDVTKNCLFLDYIDKRDAYENILYHTLENNLKNTDKSLYLCINNRDCTYTFDLKDIQYIYFDSKIRKTVIFETENFKVSTSKTLYEIHKSLDYRFMYCHKSFIINIEQIKCIDKINRKIYLKSGIKIDKVSEKCLKEIVKKLDTLYKR